MVCYQVPPDWLASATTTWDVAKKPWKEGRLEIHRLLSQNTDGRPQAASCFHCEPFSSTKRQRSASFNNAGQNVLLNEHYRILHDSRRWLSA